MRATYHPPHPELRAQQILQTAEQARRAHGDSYAYQAGIYEGEIKALCAELASLRGHGLRPSIGCDLARVYLGDAEVIVEYIEVAERAEADADDIDIQRALINGAWCDAGDVATPRQIERWAEEIAENMRLEAAAPLDDRCVEHPYG